MKVCTLISQIEGSFITGKCTSYGNVLEKENIREQPFVFGIVDVTSCHSTSNTADMRIVSRHAKPGSVRTRIVQSRSRSKFQWVESKQFTIEDLTHRLKFIARKTDVLLVIHCAATVKTANMISLIFKHRC